MRRLHPGVKVAIGPPVENGFYYDFEFPEPIREEDLAAIEAEVARELSEGRTWERAEVGHDQARSRFEAEGERYKVELVDTADGDISLYTQGDFTDLCRGPHLQDSKPIKAFKLTGLAGAYWRGDEKNTQLTRIYGTAFFTQADLDAYLERLEQARANDHRRLGTQLDLFHFDEHSPGSPFWHPKGMVLFNVLEDLRRSENATGLRRGANPDHLRQVPLGDVGALGEVQGEHVPDPGGRAASVRPQADELPGPHAPLPLAAAQLSRPARPVRRGGPLHRNELAGALHGLTRVRYVTQDDAHIFCAEDQIDAELDGSMGYLRYLYGLFGIEPRGAVHAARQQARLGRGVGLHRGQADRGARAPRDRVLRRRGRGVVLRAEDRPARKRLARPLVAAGHDPARRADACALRSHLHGGRQQGASRVRRPPRALRLLRALHRPCSSTTPAPSRLARAGAGEVVPVAEGHHRAADELEAALRASDVRVEVDARRDARKRIRDAELQKVPYVVVWGDRETREAMAVRRRGGEGVSSALSRGARRGDRRAVAAAQLKDRSADFACEQGTACYVPCLQSRSGIAPHLAGHGPREVQPSRFRRGMPPHAVAFHEEGGSTRLGELP